MEVTTMAGPRSEWARGKLVSVQVFTENDASAALLANTQRYRPYQHARVFPRTVKAGLAESKVWVVVIRERVQ